MKKHLLAVTTLLAMAALACSFSQVTDLVSRSTPAETASVIATGQSGAASGAGCGDGACDDEENAQDCPLDCANPAAVSTPQAAAAPALFEKGSEANTYWVKNPTSGNRLFVQAVYPAEWSGQGLRTLVLVPGGAGTIDPLKARRLADQGFTVVFFDPDGRRNSQGQENLGGTIHQDGLAAVIRAAATMPGVDPKRIGLVSYSYGVTMASGALSRYPDLPVKFLIDWEGPADRQDTTMGCKPGARSGWPDCNDQAAWAQREALTFIAKVKTPYLRLQSAQDHVQPDVSHAVNMVNAAIKGGSAWVRLNDLALNQSYDPNKPPTMLPEKADSDLELLTGRFADELFSYF